MQFTGGTRIIETMQEALQGMRMVKAFALEDEMRRRLEKSVAEVQHESEDGPRRQPRQPGDGNAGRLHRALATIYGGYRVIETGATPGELISSWRRSCSPTSRRNGSLGSNIDLNNSLVGVRILYEVIDSPPGEPERPSPAAVAVDDRAYRIRRCEFFLLCR